MKSRCAALAGAVSLLLTHAAAEPWSSGPPDARTGAPGEETCRAFGCHESFPLNSGGGSVTITGVPPAYDQGITYDLVVRLRKTGQERWGFQLRTRTSQGAQGGTLQVTNAVQTQISVSNGIGYLKHKLDGTFLGQADSASWAFRWIAPNAGTGAVTFYVAGNASDRSGGPEGDYIYTAAIASNDRTPVESRSWGRVKSLFR
jgi:hypothetical protein